MRTFARVVFVLTILALDLAFVVPDILRPIHPLGSTGIAIASAPGVVASADPGSAAAKAHIVAGDVISLPNAYERARWLDLGFYVMPYPGASENLTIVHGNQTRHVTLVADRYTLYPPWMAALRVLIEVFWVVLAAFLVLRRPNVTTWSFFLFSIFPGVGTNDIAGLTYPHWSYVLFILASAASFVIGNAAGIIFVLSLGEHPVPRWHWVAASVLIPLFIVLTAPGPIHSMMWIIGGAAPALLAFSAEPAYGNFLSFFAAGVYLVLLGIMYSENRGTSRQQILWVTVGIATFEVTSIANSLLPPIVPTEVNASLAILGGTLPLCVTYAVLKHRLIDINFFISRTLVYAILSGGVIAAFALVDWLFSKELDNQRLGSVAEVGVAIALGFWFNNIHRRIDYFVDSVFFRRKHLAEKHLQHLARALQHAPSEAAISKRLIDEPVSALELSSAALFKRNGDQTYQRVYARGWSDAAVADLHDDDTLILRMQLDRDAVVLDDVITGAQNLPRGSAKPDIALPVHVRNDLVAVVFYGGHTHGEHLDGDEIRAISALVNGAAAGYSNIESRSLREKAECALAQAELAKQEARLATLETDVLRAELEAWRKTVRNDER